MPVAQSWGLPHRCPHTRRPAVRRGKYWTGIRAACEPMFHTQSLSSFAPMMNDAAAKLAGQCLDPAARREDIDDEDSEAKTATPATTLPDPGAESVSPEGCLYVLPPRRISAHSS